MLKLFLVTCLGCLLALMARSQMYRLGGEYILTDADHDQAMVSKTVSAPQKQVSVLFVGNSLTFVNDMPAMLANIASSDPANPVSLQIKAFTYPSAALDYMYAHTGALAYAQQHHVDVVVLQEHSGWYNGAGNLQNAEQSAAQWRDTVRALGQTPVLFEDWGDGAGSANLAGRTPAEEAAAAISNTEGLGYRMNLEVVPVGAAFERARTTSDSPDLYQADRHHPSPAGSYLAAMVFYRYFTGRSGEGATYRPLGMSAADAKALIHDAAPTG
ncbi:MAG TPA: hypothetical protein VGI95_15040 [Caulobacteraceae bacterium]